MDQSQGKPYRSFRLNVWAIGFACATVTIAAPVPPPAGPSAARPAVISFSAPLTVSAARRAVVRALADSGYTIASANDDSTALAVVEHQVRSKLEGSWLQRMWRAITYDPITFRVEIRSVGNDSTSIAISGTRSRPRGLKRGLPEATTIPVGPDDHDWRSVENLGAELRSQLVATR